MAIAVLTACGFVSKNRLDGAGQLSLAADESNDRNPGLLGLRKRQNFQTGPTSPPEETVAPYAPQSNVVRVSATDNNQDPSPRDETRRYSLPEGVQQSSMKNSDAPEPVSALVSFDSAPFPYNGAEPGRGAFLNVERGGQKGHRTRNGQILWEGETFNDRRVLMHIPAGFDPSRPAVMVIFFHGFGATLARDVRDRQQVPAQVSASGANVVLVAPQFAVDARDGSAGRFWEPGGFTQFLDEAARRLARLQGDPASQETFMHMPVVLVAYSGGFLPAAFSLRDINPKHRVRGVVLLDAAYGELATFAHWVAKERAGFFVSACTQSTQRQNAQLKQMLSADGVSYNTDKDRVGTGVTFLNTGSESSHRDYVNHAWVKDPLKDVLKRIPGIELRDNVLAARKNIPNGPPDPSSAGELTAHSGALPAHADYIAAAK